MMWMCEHLASASWLCLAESITLNIYFGGSRISCLVGCWNHSLKNINNINHWDSMRDGKLAAGKTFCARARHNNRQRRYLCLNDHYAKLCKSVGACSCDSLTSSPKTLERIWCEQEDGPVGSLFSVCLLICFWKSIWGQGAHRAGFGVLSSSKFNHFGPCHYLQIWEAKEIENSLGDKNPQMEPRRLCWHVFWCFLASPSGTQRTECTACAAWSEDFNERHEVKYPCRKATSYCKLSDFADCGQLNSRCTAWVPTWWS